MNWAMHGDSFKTRLFHFVDVLPVLESNAVGMENHDLNARTLRLFREPLEEDGIPLADTGCQEKVRKRAGPATFSIA